MKTNWTTLSSVLALLLLVGAVRSQLLGSHSFARLIATSNDDYTPSAVELECEQLIMAGVNYLSDIGADKMIVLGLDNRGVLQWSKHLSTPDRNRFNTIISLADVNFIVFFSALYEEGVDGMQMVKMSPEGEVLLSKIITFEIIKPYSLRGIKTRDGGIILTGQSTTPTNTKSKAFILKLSKDFEVLWQWRTPDTTK